VVLVSRIQPKQRRGGEKISTVFLKTKKILQISKKYGMDPRSRQKLFRIWIQASNRHRIPDLDPQHLEILTALLENEQNVTN
jgi:hypothetical protein